MPKETTADSSEGGLVRLKYTFRFGEKFDEPNDDWLKCIEATSDELLRAYSKVEDNALFAAFGGQKKKRLNRVFDAIGFVYPNYHYPLREQGKKRKIAALVTTVEPKGKKMKVLTHRPRYIEPVVIPEFGKGTSSAAEATETVPIVHNAEELTVVPKVLTVEPVEKKIDRAEEPKIEEIMKMPKILSLPTEGKLPKVSKAFVATPKRRRMANVLDAMLETTKALSPAPKKKIAEAAKAQAEVETTQVEAKALKTRAEAEAGPSAPSSTKPAVPEGKTVGQIAPEKIDTPAPEASNKSTDYIIRHASGKELS
jgi:hypothetical protein